MAEATCGGGPNREDLVDRLFEAFAVQVRDVEAEVAAHEGKSILEDSKLLAALAKTMEVLLSLEQKVSREDGDPVDLEAVRAELVSRLETLSGAKAAGGHKAADTGEARKATKAGATARS